MAVSLGADTVTSISRRYIIPRIVDNVYNSNVLFYRWWRANKITQQGGTSIQQPLMYKRMNGGGPYRGYQLLTIAPSTTVQNANFTWKQYYQAVTVDGLTLLRADSPLAVADYLAIQFKQAEMQMATTLGAGLWSTGATTKAITGTILAIDNGTIATTYGGIAHSGNSWWNCQVDSSTTTLSLSAMQKLFTKAKSGGRTPTIIFATPTNYNRYWALNYTFQQFPVQPQGRTVQLAQAGFENLLFNGVPMLTTSHIPNAATTTKGSLFFFNEDYITMVVASRAQFKVEDFQTPVNQDAMTSKLLWAGNLVFSNIQRQAKFTALTA